MARNPYIKQLYRSRDPRQRALGRRLARGRLNNLDFELQAALDTSARVQRDFSRQMRKDGAGPATGSPVVGADVYTPNAGSGRKRNATA